MIRNEEIFADLEIQALDEIVYDDLEWWQKKLILERLYTEAFGYDSGIRVWMDSHGNTHTDTTGEGRYCPDHPIASGGCPVIASVKGWSATDISYIYDSPENEDPREGYVYDREAQYG